MGLAAFGCALLAGIGLQNPCAPPDPAPIDPPPRDEIQLLTLPGEPELPYYLYFPSTAAPGAPVFVTVHGISRNADRHVEAFAQHAASRGAVLVAPRFSSRTFTDYQRLGRMWAGPRADQALDQLVAHVVELTGADGDSLLLFGYSGGAQFVHRYTMAHPERVAAAAVSSPGWFTFPDPGRWYPYGIRATPRLPGVDFDPEAFLDVPILVTVGERDVKRGRSLRISHHLDQQQGRTRLERAERWVSAMSDAARSRAREPRVELAVLEGVHHSFGENVEKAGLAEVVAEHLFAPESVARLGRSPKPIDRAAFPWPLEEGAPGSSIRVALPDPAQLVVEY